MKKSFTYFANLNGANYAISQSKLLFFTQERDNVVYTSDNVNNLEHVFSLVENTCLNSHYSIVNIVFFVGNYNKESKFQLVKKIDDAASLLATTKKY